MALLKGTMSALWILFILTISSAELFNETPIDNLYQEENDLGAEASPPDEQLDDEYWRRSELLYKLMKYLQRDPDIRYQGVDNMDEARPTWSQIPGVKEPGVKRWLSVFNSSAAKTRPQRKWKIKKGRGPQLCYFKLCSFRTFN
ncbi:unnamed protein product, partial [Brenthis ino]